MKNTVIFFSFIACWTGLRAQASGASNLDGLAWQGSNISAALSWDYSNTRYIFCADGGGDYVMLFDLGSTTNLTSSPSGSARSAMIECHNPDLKNIAWKSDQYKAVGGNRPGTLYSIWFSDSGTIIISGNPQALGGPSLLNQTEGECYFLSNNGSGGLSWYNSAGCD